MHELAIAQALAAIVERHAAGRRVTRVELRVGHLRQVVPSALELAFELVTRGSVADGAALVIEPVSVVGRCRACGATGELHDLPLTCRSCGGWDLDITQGEELEVRALELEDPAAQRALTTAGRGGHGD